MILALFSNETFCICRLALNYKLVAFGAATRLSGSHTIRIVQFTYPNGDVLPRSSAEAGSAAMDWTFDAVPNCVTVGI